MIHILVALGAEATPLIHYWKLQKDVSSTSFRIYQRDDIQLIISGSGRISAAAATAWLASRSISSNGIWINIGTAGHGYLKKEQLFIACKIQETATSRQWFPPQIIKKNPHIALSELTTVDQVTTIYEPIGYDMEASGFLATAQRFTTLEFIQCLKIVSDTQDEPSHALQAKDLTKMVETQCEQLDEYIQSLNKVYLTHVQQTSIDIEYYTKKWHFSVTQQHQLRELLRHHHTLKLNVPENNSMAHLKTAEQFLSSLQQQILTYVPALNHV